MRRISTSLGALLVLGVAAACGPPPPALNANVTFSNSCVVDPAMMRLDCPATTPHYQGGRGEGDPPLVITCLIDTSRAGGTRFNISVGRSRDGNISSGEGVRICGSVAGPGQEANPGSITFFAGGNTFAGNVPGPCTVRVTEVSGTSISGQFKCNELSDAQIPPRIHNIRGSTIEPMTAEADWADFSLTTCTRAAIDARGGC